MRRARLLFINNYLLFIINYLLFIVIYCKYIMCAREKKNETKNQ